MLMRGNVLQYSYIYHQFNSLMDDAFSKYTFITFAYAFIYAFYFNEKDVFNIPKMCMYFLGSLQFLH